MAHTLPLENLGHNSLNFVLWCDIWFYIIYPIVAEFSSVGGSLLVYGLVNNGCLVFNFESPEFRFQCYKVSNKIWVLTLPSKVVNLYVTCVLVWSWNYAVGYGYHHHEEIGLLQLDSSWRKSTTVIIKLLSHYSSMKKYTSLMETRGNRGYNYARNKCLVRKIGHFDHYILL